MIRKFVIESRELFAEGHSFDSSGPYETIRGRVHGEVHPRHPLNRPIVNLDKAPTNERHAVEYSCDVYLLKPVDLSAGNARLLYEPPNRGNKRALMFLNDAPPSNAPRTLADAGNGFLMRCGYTWVTSGWQADLLDRAGQMLMDVPIASNGNSPIVRRIRTEVCVKRKGTYSFPLSGDARVQSYPAASLDKTRARLTARVNSYEARQPVPTQDWEFARCIETPEGQESSPSAEHLFFKPGFAPGTIYELAYLAKDPLVLGLGFAAVRDLISFLRYVDRDALGNENPLRTGSSGHVEKAYAWGRSQSGRFLRDYVYQGFNADEAGRQVFEAVAPHAAGGGRIFLNYEFARPVTSSQQHTNQLEPELFPFAYGPVRDPATGREDSILKRPATDPLVLHTQTSTEYWQKRGALVHTDGSGNDVDLPDNLRVYLISSAQHNTPYGTHARKEMTEYPTNPMTIGPILRALITAMDGWASHGTLPPPNEIPTVRNGTLVPPTREATGFPEMEGLTFTGLHNRQRFLDYGPDVDQGRISSQPVPLPNSAGYVILVPKTDRDGNDSAGLRAPWIRVPLGTYTGWNLQSSELAYGELAGLLGSYVPFAKTREERLETADPRPSIAERYRNVADYLDRMRAALAVLVEQRLVLEEDIEPILRDARKVYERAQGQGAEFGRRVSNVKSRPS